MKCTWIEPFATSKYKFCGSYCFTANTSNYNYLISRNGKSIIIDNDLLNCLMQQNVNEDFLLKLMIHGLVNITGINHCHTNDCNIKSIQPSVFIIDITKACNLNCVYCFRDLSNHKTIDKRTLSDICEYIDRNVIELDLNAISVQLWGGEPLCAMDCIRFVSDFFQTKNYTVKLDIETNATLITPEIAKELYKRKISVGVSIDGYPDIQNKQRPFSNGQESSDAIKVGVQNLKNIYGNSFGGICVITKNNYRHLPELLNYYINDLKMNSIKFNLVRDNPNASVNSIGLSIDEAQWFANQMIESLKLFRILGMDFTEGNIVTKYHNLIGRDSGNCCISQGCTGGLRILSFDMQGDIYPCEMTDYQSVKLGNIYSNCSLKQLIENSYKENSYYKQRSTKECVECPWHYFCKGGCSSRVHYINQPNNIDEIECSLNRVIYPVLVEHILNNEISSLI